ncbi:hypothetical protein BDV59DRAFT_84953 [Aspergillus ambiguus]|uniref:uncharacterized protein n=1 Tax=Aspergillus ambiguus TaxID=176160 RepID=UPI003CCCF8F7
MARLSRLPLSPTTTTLPSPTHSLTQPSHSSLSLPTTSLSHTKYCISASVSVLVNIPLSSIGSPPPTQFFYFLRICFFPLSPSFFLLVSLDFSSSARHLTVARILHGQLYTSTNNTLTGTDGLFREVCAARSFGFFFRHFSLSSMVWG